MSIVVWTPCARTGLSRIKAGNVTEEVRRKAETPMRLPRVAEIVRRTLDGKRVKTGK